MNDCIEMNFTAKQHSTCVVLLSLSLSKQRGKNECPFFEKTINDDQEDGTLHAFGLMKVRIFLTKLVFDDNAMFKDGRILFWQITFKARGKKISSITDKVIHTWEYQTREEVK